MAATDTANFLVSLAVAIAAADGTLQLGREIFVIESPATAALSVTLRPYGGPGTTGFAGVRYGSASVQADARGDDGEAVLALLYRVYDALHDGQQRPRMRWSIDGYRRNASTNAAEADPAGGWRVRYVRRLSEQVPGLIGREQNRHFGTFNFDVGWDRIPA